MSLIICMLLLHTFSAQSYLLQRSSCFFFFYIWLNMRQYVIQNEVISQEANLASLPSSLECWWWFEDGKCDWQMVRVELCLSVFALLHDCEQLSARLIDTNVPEQDIFLHWWLFPTILVSSVLFYPWFSLIERLFVSDSLPPPPLLSIFWLTVT